MTDCVISWTQMIATKGPVIVSSRDHCYNQHDKEDKHGYQSPLTLCRSVMEIVPEQGQTRQMGQTGKPCQSS